MNVSALISIAHLLKKQISTTGKIFIIILWGVLFMTGSVFAENRFPAPEFDSGYVVPAPATPLPHGDYSGYVDLILLCVAMCLASWPKHSTVKYVF